jgi:hypothetical protein
VLEPFIADADFAHRLAQIALGHVTREYPNKLDHVMTGPADAQTPRQLHPVFYGSFDWHSCVHSYWLLARLRRSFSALPERSQIDLLFDSHLTEERLSGECGYLERPQGGSFERPYGWAWLLMLAEELRAAGGESARWECATICRNSPTPSALAHISTAHSPWRSRSNMRVATVTASLPVSCALVRWTGLRRTPRAKHGSRVGMISSRLH